MSRTRNVKPPIRWRLSNISLGTPTEMANHVQLTLGKVGET